MKVNIYILSSVKSPKRQSGTVGFVLEDETTKATITQFGSVQNVTKNQSYLLGLKFALKRMRRRCELEIYSDCEYLEAAFTQEWIAGWVERDWKTEKGTDVANKEEWKSVLDGLHGMTPQFHTGEKHSFYDWLNTEVERRAKKNV